MKGGCFGKILTFIFGAIFGVVLLAGTVVGAGYYFVTQVTVNDVEKTANTEFTFIDKDAEIRDKSLYDIYNLVMNGDIKNITVKGVKKTFGVDIIAILEKTLEITIDDSHRAELEDLPVLQVFQGDNLKIVLNCVTLNDVLTKAGIDKSTLDGKPLISDRYNEPVIDAFNAILKELDFDKMKIGDMEYLVGLNLGSGILDNLKNYAVSGLNSAIDDITFEKILPDFDRDYYYLVKDGGAGVYTTDVYYADGYELIDFAQAYVLIADGETVAEADRYAMNEDGTMAQANDGIYKIDGTLPLIEDRYALAGEVYTQNRYGVMKVADGTAVTDRYVKNSDNTYTADAKGQYKKKFTTVNNGGEKYVYSYVKNFVETAEGSGVYVLEQRKLVALDDVLDLGAAEKLVVNTTVDGGKTTNKLIPWTAETSAKYVLAHTGTSERMLQALADMSLNTLNDKIGSLTIGDVIDVTDSSSKILIALKDTPIDKLGEKVGTLKLSEVMDINDGSSKILQELKDTTIDGLSAAIDNLKLKDIVDIKEKNIVTAAAAGEYISLPALAAGKTYKGSFIEGYTSAESTETLYLVKYIDGIDAAGKYFNGCARYSLPAENKASSGILVSLADVTVKNLSNIEDVIMNSVLGKVIDIDGDVFVSTDYTSYSSVPAAERDDAYIYVDAQEDVMRGIESTDTSAVIYKKIYSGEGNAIIKKMAAIKINNIASRVQVVIDETKLSEVVSVQKNNVLEEAADGAYIALSDGEYVGSYKSGVFGTNTVKMVKYSAGIDGAGEYFEGMQRYNIVSEASNAVLAGMADKKIKNLTADMQTLIDDSRLGGVIDIDGDVYKLTAYTAYTDVPAALRSKSFTYLDANEDIMRLIQDGDTVIYERVYSGADSAIIKKMASIKVGNVASRIQTVVDETRLDEVLTVHEEFVLAEATAAQIADVSIIKYVSLPSANTYYGTFNKGRIENTATEISFVKETDAVDVNDAANYFYGQKLYVITQEVSNGVLIKVANKKIGELTSGMQEAVNETLMSDVIDISGNVYTKLTAVTFVTAQAEAGTGVQVYYLDVSGLFLKADATSTATEFYVMCYHGKSNAMLRKLATITVEELARGDTLDKAVNDCTLEEVGVTITSGSLMYELKDTKIGNLDSKVSELLSDSKMDDLNKWANLGLTDVQLNKTYGGVRIGDMTVKDFVTAAITVMTVTP